MRCPSTPKLVTRVVCAAIVACVSALSGCDLEDPVSPERATEPEIRPEMLNVRVGATCEPGSGACIPGDLKSVSFRRTQGSSWVVEHTIESQGTAAGSRFQVHFCIRREWATNWSFCGYPVEWHVVYPGFRPDGGVQIYGRWPLHFPHVSFIFEGPVHDSEMEKSEFERPEPDPDGCGHIFGLTVCRGRIRAVVDLKHIAWWPGELDAYVETRPGGRRVNAKAEITHVEGPGTSNPARYAVELDQAVFFSAPDAEPMLLVEYDSDRGKDLEVRFPLWRDAPPLTLTADPDELDSPGESVDFLAEAEGAEVLEILDWRWEPDGDGQAETNACEAEASEATCRTDVHETGTMYVTARVDGVRREASAKVDVEARPCTDADIRIVRAAGPNPGGSFTTATEENTIRMEADLSGGCEDLEVEWEVRDHPESAVVDRGPGSLPREPHVEWTVPRQDRSRWTGYGHPGALSEKFVGFEPIAFALDGGERVASASDRFRQDETDVVRQEYIDYRRRWVPPRFFWGRPGSPHFSPAELNRRGDYGVYIASQHLLKGLEALRAGISSYRGQETPLFVTNAFRNPVHQTEHIGSDHSESWHQYGFAADIRIWDHEETRERFWDKLRRVAKRLPDDACVEPKSMLRIETDEGDKVLSHFHVDWRPKTCPNGW